MLLTGRTKQHQTADIVAIHTGDRALLQIERILAAFRPGDAALLSRMVLVAQGGSVAYRFVPHLPTAEGARLEQHIRVELVQEWNGCITLQLTWQRRNLHRPRCILMTNSEGIGANRRIVTQERIDSSNSSVNYKSLLSRSHTHSKTQIFQHSIS